MIGTAVENPGVQVRARVVHEAVKEIGHEFGLQIAYQTNLDAVFVYQRGPSSEIHRNDRERFIHRKHEIAGAVNAFPIAQRFGEKLAYDDTYILHGVMLIDVKISRGRKLEIERAVLREEFQHVIEETDAG
jgi:hypothetical protein